MEAIKLKLEKLRLDADASTTRADKAEIELKEINDLLSTKDLIILNLSNKITLLTEDVTRQEKRVEEVKLKQSEGEKGMGEMESLNRRVNLLERTVDDKEAERKDAVEKCRALELVTENAERKVRQLESDRSELEKKLADLAKVYEAVKTELALTLKGLEDL